MSHTQSAVEAIQQLMAGVEDPNTTKILLAICTLAERLDQLQSENNALRDRLARVEHRLPDTGTMDEASDEPRAFEPPVFTSEISEYDRGVLFENDEGFDLKVQFTDSKSWEWYRVWGFRDAGHVLHVLLESCARTACAEYAGDFTYRRDGQSATVYATQRVAIERLLSRFLQICDTDEGTLQLIEHMNLGLSE